MKKIFILVALVLLCTGCFLNKWSFKINDDYHIEHEGVDDIYLYNKDKKVLDKYISQYAVIDHYIYLETLRNYNDNIVMLYYLVDMDTNKLEGPFTEHNSMDVLGKYGLIVEEMIDTTKRS